MNPALQCPGVALTAAELIGLRAVALNARSEPVLAALPGGFATRRKGHGQEVADIREYVDGDDIRHLDRGTTARTGQLHVRQFQEERDRVTLLVADFRPAMHWGLGRAFRSVAAAEVLSLVGWRLVEEGARVGLLAVVPGDPVVVPARGRTRGMLRVIGGLVRAHQQSLEHAASRTGADASLVGALRRADRLCPPGSEILIASGFDGEGQDLTDQLNALDRRRHTRLIMVSDADPARLPAGGYPVRTSDGRRLRLMLGQGTAPTSSHEETVAGRRALRIDAAEPVAKTAQRVAGAFAGGIL